MHRAKKPPVIDFNEHLTCKICKGYFIDATTIIECLHSFCRSCIVKYLQTNKYCPVCDVQVHKTKPLLNIRADKTLQDVVYKLVPKLFQSEVQRQHDFYLSHPEAKHNQDQIKDSYQHIVIPEESISLTLSYYGCDESARYLRCPAAVSIGHLQKLIRAKYGLFDNHHHVDILYNQDCLNSSLTLVDVAYIYSWKRKAPIEFTYRVYEYTAKKRKIEEKQGKSEVQMTNSNWKEVQLRISENGEMSIIQGEALELVNNNNYKPEIVTVVDNKKELPELKYISKCTLPEQASVATSCSTATKTVFSTINSTKCSVSSDSDKRPKEVKSEIETNKPPEDKGVKRKQEQPTEEPTKQQKQTILNHSIGLHHLSNNHPLKKHAQLKKPETCEETAVAKPNVGTPKPASKPCYMPKPVINIPKPSTSVKNDKLQPVCSSPGRSDSRHVPTTTTSPPPSKLIKSKASTPIGYKTLRDPPKSWNSQIAKANLNKPVTDPKYSELKNVRPAKFFKMRNNLPRYLGNPASGVKPMYQVHVSPEKEKEKPPECPPVKGEIRKHSIVKIDPKTLKPISEKAPEMTSLSNSSSDLKISTSSVSIFSPLKLQNSPKGERRSPKSPHSPKTSKTTAAASPPSKRDKLSLNFTPSNPFIPNLASRTVSPNQFLYPPGPPGFPPYDPRVMAAYQHLFYSQRMPFPAGLTLDLNQRKGFDMPGPTSPKLGGMPQPHSPQHPTLKLPNAEQLSMAIPSRTALNSTPPTNSSGFKTQATPKKNAKESSNKSEKSLQNAVEKLTQNRVKEIKNVAAVKKQPIATTAAAASTTATTIMTSTPPPTTAVDTRTAEKSEVLPPLVPLVNDKVEGSKDNHSNEDKVKNSNTNGEIAKRSEEDKVSGGDFKDETKGKE